MNPITALKAWRAASRIQKGIAMLKEMRAGTEPVAVGEIVRAVAVLLALFGIATLDERVIQALITLGALGASWWVSRQVRAQVTPEIVAQARVAEAAQVARRKARGRS